MSSFDWDIIKKWRIVYNITKLNMGDSNDDKMEVIWDRKIYVKKLEGHLLLGCYYQVLLKSYFKKEDTWNLMSII